MLTRKEQEELARLESRFQKNRMTNTIKPASLAAKSKSGGLTAAEKDELKRLQARLGRIQLVKTERKPEAVKPEPDKPAPEIHVHVDLPEITKPEPAEAPEPCVVAPRQWVFEHKYDEYGKLVKTTATAQ